MVRFSEWERQIADGRRNDPLWRMRVHRLASYLATESWRDASRLAACKVTASVADQLYRSVGSIVANIAEGYSRSSPLDRARILEYALGSAREAREWYLRSAPVLGDDVVRARQEILDEILRLLLATIPRIRKSASEHDGRL